MVGGDDSGLSSLSRERGCAVQGGIRPEEMNLFLFLSHAFIFGHTYQ